MYQKYHPGKIVKDHVLSREIARQQGRLSEALDPANIEPKPWEMNDRKAVHERTYLRDRQRYIDGGLTPEQADAVLQETLDWIMKDALPRLLSPRVVDRITSSGPR